MLTTRLPKHRAGDPPPQDASELLTGHWHVGRSFDRQAPALEATCPCPKAPCGLVVPTADAPCEQHHGAKTIRQAHRHDDCPKVKPRFNWWR